MISESPKSRISARKAPVQVRASSLVTAVLEAAVQILRAEGAARFTTARIAARAGVSVGSIYQYFPNKVSILFRLQADEWQRTAALLGDILADGDEPPRERLRRLVHAFIRSECDEAEVRLALSDAAPLYRDEPEAAAARESGTMIVRTFMAQVLPTADDAQRARTADLIEATLMQVGSSFSAVPRTQDEIAAFADEMADMFDAYLERVEGNG